MAVKPKLPKSNPEAVWVLTFEGIYQTRKNEERPFKKDVRMQQKHFANGAALSVFKKHLADDVMPQDFPDYLALKKFRVTGCVNEDNPEMEPDDIHVMSRDQLIEFIDANNMHIITSLCPNVDAIRTAILEYIDDPEAFVKNQAMIQKKRGPQIETREGVQALNQKAKEPAKSKPAPAAEPVASKPKGKGRKAADPVETAPPEQEPEKEETEDVLAGV